MKLIAGPCVIESVGHCKMMAQELRHITKKYDVDFYFKASFDKANRTNLSSFRGIGIKRGIKCLYEIKQDYDLKVTTDFHTPAQVAKWGWLFDLIQIPALLCRQTDLLATAGKVGKPVNIKKGQFADYKTMLGAKGKIGHPNVWMTERGSCYGRRLVVEFDNIPIFKSSFDPVIIDCTHPSDGGNQLWLAKQGLRHGCGGVFMEVHDEPEKAKCDGSKSVKLSEFEGYLGELLEVYYGEGR